MKPKDGTIKRMEAISFPNPALGWRSTGRWRTVRRPGGLVRCAEAFRVNSA